MFVWSPAFQIFIPLSVGLIDSANVMKAGRGINGSAGLGQTDDEHECSVTIEQ